MGLQASPEQDMLVFMLASLRCEIKFGSPRYYNGTPSINSLADRGRHIQIGQSLDNVELDEDWEWLLKRNVLQIYDAQVSWPPRQAVLVMGHTILRQVDAGFQL